MSILENTRTGTTRPVAATPASAVSVEDAVVTFGRTTVLGPVSLDLPAGSTVAVLGHNGAGKTTLLRLMAGIVVPVAGSVRVAGVDPTRRWREVARVVGSSFYPERAFYFRLSVAANLEYFQSLQKVFGRRARDERDRLLRQVGLADIADRKFMELSLGQRKRVGLAKAMIGDPAVVLLDEPLANLDDEGRAVVSSVVTDRARQGRTTVFTTHQMGDVRDAVTEVVRVAHGSLVHERISDAEDSVPCRRIEVRGGPRAGCDLSGVSAIYRTTTDGDRIRLTVPVDVRMSTVLAQVEEAGVAVASVWEGEHLSDHEEQIA